jgi:acetyl-CoA acyltransferase 1
VRIFEDETYMPSSRISDGASAVILARRAWADAHGLKPLGRFIATRVSGCAPDEMGISPIFAIPAVLRYAGISSKDVDIFELNEAFASQTIYCIEKLGLEYEKVNPNGGAIALGHPTGATGARQTATMLAELRRRDKEIGVVSMCARYVKKFSIILRTHLILNSTGIGVASMFITE